MFTAEEVGIPAVVLEDQALEAMPIYYDEAGLAMPQRALGSNAERGKFKKIISLALAGLAVTGATACGPNSHNDESQAVAMSSEVPTQSPQATPEASASATAASEITEDSPGPFDLSLPVPGARTITTDIFNEKVTLSLPEDPSKDPEAFIRPMLGLMACYATNQDENCSRLTSGNIHIRQSIENDIAFDFKPPFGEYTVIRDSGLYPAKFKTTFAEDGTPYSVDLVSGKLFLGSAGVGTKWQDKYARSYSPKCEISALSMSVYQFRDVVLGTDVWGTANIKLDAPNCNIHEEIR